MLFMARSTLIVVAAELRAKWFILETGFCIRACRAYRYAEAFREGQKVRQPDAVLAAACDLNGAELARSDPMPDCAFRVPERFGHLGDRHELLECGPFGHKIPVLQPQTRRSRYPTSLMLTYLRLYGQ
jgi:hypothetical protein